MIKLNELKEMKRNEKNGFKAWVLGDILSQGNKQDIEDYLKNASYGCASGSVTSLIYYNDTKKVFSKYFEEIMEIVTEDNIEMEYQLFNDNLNYNSLTWLAYDIIISEINNGFNI